MRPGIVALLVVAACSPATSPTTTTSTTVDECAEVERASKAYEEEWNAQVEEAQGSMEQNRATFRYVESMAILAEQHPHCFTVAERVEWERSYREWVARCRTGEDDLSQRFLSGCP